MKVGLITTSFPRFEGDHCGAFLQTLARGLVAGGHRVVVLAPEPGRRTRPPRWTGIEVRFVPYARPRAAQRTFYEAGAPDNLRARPLGWLGAASFTSAAMYSAQRDLFDCDALLSSWCVPSGWIASESAAGRPHVCICHETDIRWLERAPWGRTIARRIASGVTSMWFLSASHRERFFTMAEVDANTIPSHVGPMPVEPPGPARGTREEIRRRLGLDRFTLLFVGRLVPVKGVDRLLRAVAAVEAPIHVRVAGDGPERRALSTLARDLGVDAAFEGWVRGERKEALLHASDVLVVPSRAGDGLPVVLEEAEARRLPIIATALPAIGERWSRSDDVSLVPPDDIAALSRAISRAAAHATQGATRSVFFGGW